MEIIFLFGTVQAFFLSLLILTKKKKSTGDYVLGCWMIFIGLHLLDYYSFSTMLFLKYPKIGGIGMNFPLLQGPFMFVYVLIMTNKTGRFKKIYLLNALPFVLVTIYFLFNFYFLNATEKLSYYHIKIINVSTPFLKINWILNVFLGPVYVVLSLIKLRKHSKTINKEFSYTEHINLNWLKYVIAGLGFVWIIVLLTMVVRFFIPSLYIGKTDNFIYFSVTAAVFFLGFFGFKQQTIYSDASGFIKKQKTVSVEEKTQKERYQKSGLNENKAKEYLDRLLQFVEKDKPYLDNNLNLKNLSDHLGISANHLSQVINEQLHVSFFDFINKYRVEEFKSRLSKPDSKQYTILAIAYDCGFNSKSGFNIIFKKMTGLTPSQFIKEKTT